MLESATDRGRVYDWMMRIPIVSYSIIILAKDVYGFLAQAAVHPVLVRELDSGIVIALLARASQWTFIALLAILPFFRLPPVRKSDRLWPRFVAVAAVGLIPMFMLLERAPADVGFNAAAMLIALVANTMSVVTVSFLGRSLSVMPEARRLVTAGPYGVVRHPLYLCEILGVTAMVLQYRSMIAIGLFAAIVTLQVLRARAEEAVLARAFPDFLPYCQRIPFLLPRDPARFVTAFILDPAARLRSAAVIAASMTAAVAASLIAPLLAG